MSRAGKVLRCAASRGNVSGGRRGGMGRGGEGRGKEGGTGRVEVRGKGVEGIAAGNKSECASSRKVVQVPGFS